MFFKKSKNISDSVLHRFRNGDTAPANIKKNFSFSEEEINDLMWKAVTKYNEKHNAKIFLDEIDFKNGKPSKS
ncbi:hypothetical protein [Pectobacterium versatile]|uniref:hypothetical protein n=1 Tax=Pectobacterium versatile TaxID=2488639 RepID=UPI001B386431|nr:hypothetical protein [Pectobacterium versatile]MBQ4778645.1 hypothetical protein [Pectobacterium versatile]